MNKIINYRIITYLLSIIISSPTCFGDSDIRAEIVGQWVFYNDDIDKADYGEYYNFYDINSECSVFGFKPNTLFPAYPKNGRFYYSILSNDVVKITREKKVYVFLRYLKCAGSIYLVETNEKGEIIKEARLYRKKADISFSGVSARNEKYREALDYYLNNPSIKVTTRLAGD